MTERVSFFEELRRRNVFRVGIAYTVGGWLLLQLTDVLSELLRLPETVGPVVVAVVAIGFPIVLFAAWALELTPQGLKLESELATEPSITRSTGKKLNALIVVLMAIAIAYLLFDKFMVRDGSPPDARDPQTVTENSGNRTLPSDAQHAELPVSSQSIAVLPFANRSNNADDLFFTDGIHDDLLTQLAKLDDLKVISRTSVMEYRDTTRKISDIAQELSVSTILEGGVQRAGNRIRINAQLIDVRTDEHLWAETFDREMTIDNIFDIQSEITRQIVTAVRGEMTASDAASLTIDRPTNSLAAWEAFLQAKSIINTDTGYNAEKYQSAESWVKKALEADPDFAEAWALLARVQLQGIWIGYANTEAQRDLAGFSLERAASLKPGTAAILRAEADYEYRVNLNYQRALELQKEARRLAPGDAETLMEIGTTLRRLGRWDEACEAFLESLALDPLNGFAATTYLETLVNMNAWDRLEPELNRFQARHPKSVVFIEHRVTLLIHGRGQVDEADRYLDGLPEELQDSLWPRQTVAFYKRDWDAVIAPITAYPGEFLRLPIYHFTKDLALGNSYARKGEKETARTYMQAYLNQFENQASGSLIGDGFRKAGLAAAKVELGEMEAAIALAHEPTELLPKERDWMTGGFFYRNKSWVLAKAGQRDQALELITELLDKPGGYARWDLHLSPDWDFFRDDPRFNELVRPDGVEPQPFRRSGEGT